MLQQISFFFFSSLNKHKKINVKSNIHWCIFIELFWIVNDANIGSKAKFAIEEPDVLDIGGFDSTVYLSEIDDKPEKHAEKPALNSVIVIPKRIEKSNPFKRARASHRAELNHQPRGRHTDTVASTRPPIDNLTSQTVVGTVNTIETRSIHTQTERTGPCKCARSAQNRNRRKRLDNKTNKQIVETLERIDIIKFQN